MHGDCRDTPPQETHPGTGSGVFDDCLRDLFTREIRAQVRFLRCPKSETISGWKCL